MKKHPAVFIILALCAACLICFAVCCAVYNKTEAVLASQTAAQRWRADNELNFAQVSIFRSGGEAMNFGDIHSLREKSKEALLSVSLDADEDGNLIHDAFCAISTATVSSQRTKSVQTTLYAIGGDYFFHPLKLESGSYISEDDLSDDLVVLDRELSWSLFGSVDSVGLTLNMDGRDYIVAGVVARDGDRFSRKTNSDVSCIFVLFPAVYDYESNVITSYETVMPDPVENFALGTIESLSPSGDKIENSKRFTPGKISDFLLSFGKRAVSVSTVVYPHWELAARLCEDHLAVTLFIAALSLVLPAVCAVIGVVLAYKALRKTGKRMITKIRGL